MLLYNYRIFHEKESEIQGAINPNIMRFLCTIFITAIFSVKTFSQTEPLIIPIDSTTGKIAYSEVVMVDTSLSKQELYSRAREWFAKTYNSSTDVIQMDDKENGKIVGKALMQVYCKSIGSDRKCGFVNYTISTYVKDGRYRFELTDFYHTGRDYKIDCVNDSGNGLIESASLFKNS